MTYSSLPRIALVTPILALFSIPSGSIVQSGLGHELLNRPYWSGYGPLTTYDRVKGIDAIPEKNN